MKIAFQGERGAYGEEAARAAFPDHDRVGHERFADVFEAVREGRADRGVVPIENSQAGSITEVYDLLLEHPLELVGEVDLRIRHCLLALRGETLETLKTAHSHPQALAQSDAFLRAHRLKPIAESNTAASAKKIAEQRLAGAAAVGSRAAAELYGLQILAEGVETNPDNRTRFVVLSRERAPRVEGPSRTSLVLGLAHEPGSLHRALGVLAARGINLTKLESRPSRLAAWEYVFYLDLEGHRDDPGLAAALVELGQRAGFLRVLGSYARSPRGS